MTSHIINRGKLTLNPIIKLTIFFVCLVFISGKESNDDHKLNKK